MMDYLLDTNICIELIRSRSAKILRRLQKCQIGQVGISSITLAELEYGVYKSREPPLFTARSEPPSKKQASPSVPWTCSLPPTLWRWVQFW
jgi:predicted nucleic acid-binding protein